MNKRCPYCGEWVQLCYNDNIDNEFIYYCEHCDIFFHHTRFNKKIYNDKESDNYL